MASGHDDVVASCEKARRLFYKFLFACLGQVRCLSLRAHDIEHMFTAGRICKVVVHALAGLSIHVEAVVGVPIVKGDNFKQIGDAAKGRNGVAVFAQGQPTHNPAGRQNASLFRRGIGHAT